MQGSAITISGWPRRGGVLKRELINLHEIVLGRNARESESQTHMEVKTQKKTEASTPWNSINGRDRWPRWGQGGREDSAFRDIVMGTELRGKRSHRGGR